MGCLAQLYATLAHASEQRVRAAAARYVHPEVTWCVAHPVNGLHGVDEVVERFLLPLRAALPDMERRPHIALAGEYRGKHWEDGAGYFLGTFSASLWGIPASGRSLYLRYTELACIEEGRIIEYYLIPDFLDAMHQVGVYPLQPSLGVPGSVLPPATLDGIYPRCDDAAYSAASEQLVMAMLDCLRRYDGHTLESMDLENYWHPDFMWYGPGGIGTTRGIEGFRRHHQGPFLAAFPDRDVDFHANTIACGDYVATGGWPHMHGTHRGGGWLGVDATQRKISLRVMDIWRREGDLLRENWVAIDIPDMLSQMGLDVFDRIKALTDAGVPHG